MAEKSITVQRAELTKVCVEQLEEIFRQAGVDFFRTGDNLSTLTYECGEIAGQPVYGSIKFTLHKNNYNLDNEIETFELILEQRERNEEEKKKKKELAEKERARKAAKAAVREKLEEKKRQELKERLNKPVEVSAE